jgi:hypothetical protein
MQSGIFLFRYQTEIMDAGIPMLGSVSSMSMPSFGYSLDNVATIWLAKAPLRCDMGDGISWTSPISILFSPKQTATQQTYSNNLDLAKSKLNRFWPSSFTWSISRLLKPRLFKKKLRPATRAVVFKNNVLMPPPAKRPQASAFPSASTQE